MNKLVTFTAYCSDQFHSTVSDTVQDQEDIFDCMHHFYINIKPPPMYFVTEQLRLEGTSGFPPSSRIMVSVPSSHHPHPKQCRILSNLSNWASSISKDGNSIASLSNLVQHLTSAHFRKKKRFSVQMEFPIFQCVPTTSCSVSGHTEESLVLSSLLTFVT